MSLKRNRDGIIRREFLKRKAFLERHYSVFLLINEYRCIGKTFKEIESYLRDLGYVTRSGSQYYSASIYRIYVTYRRYLGIRDDITDLSKSSLDVLLSKQGVEPRSDLRRDLLGYRPCMDVMLDVKLSGDYIKLGGFYGYVCYIVTVLRLESVTNFDDLYNFLDSDKEFWYDLLFRDSVLNLDVYYNSVVSELDFDLGLIVLDKCCLWLNVQLCLSDYVLSDVFIILHEYIERFIEDIKRYLLTRYYHNLIIRL